MRLINVELQRFWSRKLMWVTAIGLLAVLAISFIGSYSSSKPPSQAEMEQQEQQFQDEVRYWEEQGEEDRALCLEDEERERIAQDDPEVDFGCEYMTAPDREDWFGSDGYNWRSTFESDSEFALQFLALPILAAAVLMGTSFISAEIGTGALGNWLTFEPRRTRVFFSKAAALALGVLPITVLTLLLWFGGTLGAFAINDAIGAITGPLWSTLLWSALRTAVLAIVAAIGGYALATLTKSTAATLGVLFAYIVVAEGALHAFRPMWQPWLVSVNIRAFIDGGVMYGYEKCVPQGGSELRCDWVDKELAFGNSTVFLAVLISVLVVAAWFVFRRRDVN